MRQRLGQLWEAGRERESVDLAYRTVRRDTHAGGELLACALAMRMFILLLPFTAALLAVLGLVTRSDAATAQNALSSMGITETAAKSVTGSARITSESLWLVLAGSLGALVLGSKTTLRTLWTIHRLAWSEPESRPQRPWRGAFIVIVALVVLLSISLLSPLMRESLGLGAGIAGLGLEFALWAGFWLAVGLVLPHGSAPWSALLPGAAVFAAGTTLLHALTTFWAAGVISHYSAAYGALGTAVAMLLWFYAFGRLIVAGAMLNAARWEHRKTASAAADALEDGADPGLEPHAPLPGRAR
jgi:membrane protein